MAASESWVALLLIWVVYLAAAVLIGGAGGFLTVARWARRAAADRTAQLAVAGRLRRWALVAALVLVAAALVRLVVRTAAAEGAVSLDAMTRTASGSSWGTGWWAQLYVALLAVAGLLAASRRPRQGWSLATAAALGAAYTLPMTGAPAGDRLSLALTALHTFLAGVWIGVPLLSAAAGPPDPLPPGLASAARWTLMLGLAGAVATGAALLATEPRSLGAAVSGGYGWTLLAKLSAALVLGLTALRRPRTALAAAAVALGATVALAN